jgi:hypothetical protein
MVHKNPQRFPDVETIDFVTNRLENKFQNMMPIIS